jgi:hypothetical protein
VILGQKRPKITSSLWRMIREFKEKNRAGWFLREREKGRLVLW